MAGDLLEREREVAACGGALSDGRSGRGGLVLIEGAAGTGKTRLLARAIEQARAMGMRVLSARAAISERAFGFGVVRQLLGPVLAHADEATRRRLLAGAAALALPALELGAEAGDGTLHGLFWLLANLAGDHPLAVAVDDLHWADDASRAFLAFAARRVDGLPLTLLLAARPREPGAPVAVLDELAGEPSAHRLALHALSLRAVGAVAAEKLGACDDAFARACHDASAGNPFVLHELLATLDRNGVAPDAAHAETVSALRPDAVMRELAARLARLDGDGAALIRALTVLGDGADRAELAAFARLEPRALAAAEHDLSRLGIVTQSNLAFAHPLVRAAAEEMLAVDEHGELHARAARLRRGDPERAALHLLNVPPRGDAEAAALLHAAAGAALDRAAPDSAAILLRRALAEPPAPDVLGAVSLALGQALTRMNAAEAATPLRTALAEGTPVQRADAATLLARIHLRAGDLDGALASIAAARVDDDAGLAFRLQADRLVALRSASQPIAGDELAEFVRRASVLGRDARQTALGIQAIEHIVSHESTAAQAAAVARAALTGPRPPGDASTGRAWAGLTLVLADAFDEAETHFSAELADARGRGSLFDVAVASTWRGLARMRRGDLRGAEEDASAALEAGMDYWMGGPAACGTLVEVHVARGELGAAGAVAGASDTLSRHDDMPDDFLLSARAWLALASGRPADALATAFSSRDRQARTLQPGPGAQVWEPPAVVALLALGRTDEARELAAADLRDARHFGAPWRLGCALRGAAAADGAARADLLEEAVDVLRAAGARVELARALIELARDTSIGAARGALQEAIELAEASGASAVAGDATSALVSTGARPRRARRTGLDALTPAERRTARLVAEGRSNPEVAAALFVTPKTVEKHLSACYRKLGVRSRSQLAAALLPDR